jgi:hypothetical protein
MNQAIKAYFFIPSGFKNYIDRGFEGWGSFYFLYFIFIALLTYENATGLKFGAYIFLQPLFFLILLLILSTTAAFIAGAKETHIKAKRLTGLCLPPIGLTIFFIARKSLLTFIAVYPALLFIYGAAFLNPDKKFLNALLGFVTLALTVVIFYFFAISSVKWFGQELTFDGFKANLSQIRTFTKNEETIYRFLLFSPPTLGYIPQADEIADSLKLDRARVQNALLKLDDRGCIVLGADREIRYAYPWAMYDHGYKVLVEDPLTNSPAKPVYAASALHALSAATLFKNADIQIQSKLRDTGGILIIDINNGQIDSSNHPEAQVYKSDIISEIEFYSSPTGAKASYRGRYDSTRLLSLSRAVSVAGELMRERAPGIL